MDTMLWPILKMILVLGGLCGFLFLLVKRAKRKGGFPQGFSPESGIRLLVTQAIGPQKYISLVEIGGDVLALGVTEAQITFLSKVENKSFLEKIVPPGPVKSEPLSFLHYLQGLPLRSKGQARSGFLRRVHAR